MQDTAPLAPARGGARSAAPPAPPVQEAAPEALPPRAAKLAAAREAQAKAVSGGGSEKKDTDAQQEIHELIHKTLYDPPCNLEKLGAILQVSVVTFVPRLAQGHFPAHKAHKSCC